MLYAGATERRQTPLIRAKCAVRRKKAGCQSEEMMVWVAAVPELGYEGKGGSKIDFSRGVYVGRVHELAPVSAFP